MVQIPSDLEEALLIASEVAFKLGISKEELRAYAEVIKRITEGDDYEN